MHEHKGSTVAVKKGLPHFFEHCGWALAKAKEVLTSSNKDKKVVAKREKDKASVTVEGVPAFLQKSTDAEGTFLEPFSHLSLK